MSEQSTPKSMGQRIWDSAAKPESKKHWSFKPHRRTPKVTHRDLPVKKIKGGFSAFNGVVFDNFTAVKQAAKASDFDRVKMGAITAPATW